MLKIIITTQKSNDMQSENARKLRGVAITALRALGIAGWAQINFIDYQQVIECSPGERYLQLESAHRDILKHLYFNI